MKKTINVKITEPGLWLDSDIVYGHASGWCDTTRNLRVSIIRHFPGQSKRLPCIVWLCGGGWMQTAHNAHIPMLVTLAKRGYVIASVEYLCDVKFPAHLEEIKTAIRYLRANADKYQIDPEHFGVMGESAGGHLAGLVGTTGETRQFDVGEYLEYSSAVQAACAWYMPSNLNTCKVMSSDDTTVLQHLLGFNPVINPEKTALASPIQYVTGNTPPFLLLHGTADYVVPFSQSEEMYDMLESKSVPVEFYILEGIDHAQIEFYQPEVFDIIANFFDKYLRE